MEKITSIFKVMLLFIISISFNNIQAEENITFYHYDLLGSPVATTNEMGEVTWREEYSPYGKKLLNQDSNNDNVRGYTGHVHDAETGLTYMQARYYDPEIGRFMGVDPVGFVESSPASFNRYSYANNNPYKYVDPNGEFGMTFQSDYFSSGAFFSDFSNGFINGATDMAPGVGLIDGVQDLNNGNYALGIMAIASELPIAKPLKINRVRHFTNKKGITGIKQDLKIKAVDQNSVFTVKAKGKRKSPRDVEAQLGIKRGKGNNYVEFDANTNEYDTVKNPKTGATENVFKGDIDLSDRNATFNGD